MWVVLLKPSIVASVIRTFHLHAVNEMSHPQTVAYLLCMSLMDVYFLAVS